MNCKGMIDLLRITSKMIAIGSLVVSEIKTLKVQY